MRSFTVCKKIKKGKIEGEEEGNRGLEYPLLFFAFKPVFGIIRTRIIQ